MRLARKSGLLMETVRVENYIEGRRTAGGGPVQPVFNPASGRPVREVVCSSAADVEQAAAAARQAAGIWRGTAPDQRREVLAAFRQLLAANRARIAAAVTEEHGKTIREAEAELARADRIVGYGLEAGERCDGDDDSKSASGQEAVSRTLRAPVGVVAGISPFNFPVMVPLWMIVPALACGNAFVHKPAAANPSASLLLAELLAEAGLPAGVFNVVQGDRETAAALIAHPQIDAVSFVGSSRAAREVYSRASAAGKRVQAAGGGKNHMVVMPDANPDAAAEALLAAAYGTAGQRGLAVSVAVPVGENVADALVARLAAGVRGLRLGPGEDPDVDMGPLISAARRDRVCEFMAAGVREGAELVVDGRRPPVPAGCEKGFFVGGSLFDRVRPEMSIYREEIFGPVLAVVRVEDIDQACSLINRHRYANSAAIFTADAAAGQRFAQRVQVGSVGINVALPVPVDYRSFGGWRDSRFGASVLYGPRGVDFFTRIKTVTSRG